MKFNNLLMKRLRMRKNITLGELATLIGCTHVGVWKIETGKTDPSGKNLVQIANVLGVRAEHLYGETE